MHCTTSELKNPTEPVCAIEAKPETTYTVSFD